jgi:transposase-like protein
MTSWRESIRQRRRLRQHQIETLVGWGCTYRQVGRALGISPELARHWVRQAGLQCQPAPVGRPKERQTCDE